MRHDVGYWNNDDRCLELDYLDDEYFDSSIEEVLGTLFTASNDTSELMHKMLSERLLSVYMNLYKESESIPTLEDVEMDIVKCNWNVALKLADIDYLVGEGKNGFRDIITISNRSLPEEELISTIAEHWYASYVDETDQTNFIRGLLKELRLSYYDYSDIALIPEQYRLLCMDSQNLLFQDWHIQSMSSIFTNPCLKLDVKEFLQNAFVDSCERGE